MGSKKATTYARQTLRNTSKPRNLRLSYNLTFTGSLYWEVHSRDYCTRFTLVVADHVHSRGARTQGRMYDASTGLTQAPMLRNSLGNRPGHRLYGVVTADNRAGGLAFALSQAPGTVSISLESPKIRNQGLPEGGIRKTIAVIDA